MTIQDLGGLGELVAAIATVATLIYLALQIRANTIVSKAEARRATRVAASAVNLSIVNDENVSRIFLTGLGDPSKLEPEEWVRFSFLMGELIGTTSAIYDETSAGILTEDSANQGITINRFLTIPGGQKFSQQFGSGFSKPFRNFVEGVLAEKSADWSPRTGRSDA